MVAKVRRHTTKYFLDAIVMMTMTKSTDDDGDDNDKVNDVMMATRVVLTKMLMPMVKML